MNKTMYRVKKKNKTNFSVNKQIQGEPLERKIERMVNNGEVLDGGNVPMIYTERMEGVQAGHDIRTDRFEVAVEVADKVSKGKIAKSEARYEEAAEVSGEGDKSSDGEAKSIEGNGDKK